MLGSAVTCDETGRLGDLLAWLADDPSDQPLWLELAGMMQDPIRAECELIGGARTLQIERSR